MSKASKQKKPAATDMPKCPICGRRSTVRRVEGGMYYCDHCHQAFTTT